MKRLLAASAVVDEASTTGRRAETPIPPTLPRNARCRAALERARELASGDDRTELLRCCLIALGSRPQDATVRNEAGALLAGAGLGRAAERLRAARPNLEDLIVLHGKRYDSRLLRSLLLPSKARPVALRRNRQRPLPMHCGNDDLRRSNPRSSFCVDELHGRALPPQGWEALDLRHAQVHYHRGVFLVLDRWLRPVESCSHPAYRLLYLDPSLLDAATGRREVPRLERALYAQDHICNPNFCHWMLDTLPRLSDRRPGETVLVWSDAPRYARETLDALGIGARDVVRLEECESLRVERLRVESSVARDFLHPAQKGAPAVLSFLRERLGGAAPQTGIERLYLARPRDGRRKVANEELVLPVLERLGFVRVEGESLGSTGQAALFRDARVVVAPHGAGLSNLVFCRPGTAVLELFHPSYGTCSFFILANALGLRYYCLEGEGERLPAEARARDRGELQSADIVVPVEQIGAMLEEIIELSDRPSASFRRA